MRPDASPLLVRFLRGSEAKLSRRAIAFPPEFRARPTASRLREGKEVDSSPGFGTAPHSGAERSAAQRTAAQRSGLGPGAPARLPGSWSLLLRGRGSWIFPACFCLPEDVNNAQRGLSSLHLERLAPARVPPTPHGWISRSYALSGRGHGCTVDTGWRVGRDPQRPPRDPRLVFLCLKHLSGLLCRSEVIRQQQLR